MGSSVDEIWPKQDSTWTLPLPTLTPYFEVGVWWGWGVWSPFHSAAASAYFTCKLDSQPMRFLIIFLIMTVNERRKCLGWRMMLSIILTEIKGALMRKRAPMTNMEGSLMLANSWKELGETACGMPNRARQLFVLLCRCRPCHVISRGISFYHHETRPAHHVKFVLWDKWVEHLPHIYNPGLECTEA